MFLSYVVHTQLACVVITILEHNQSTNNQNKFLPIHILTDKEYIVKHFVILERISLPYVNEDERTKKTISCIEQNGQEEVEEGNNKSSAL